MPPLSRRLATEFVGTAFLLIAIVGSGIMAETLTTDPGLQLFENALATAAALTALMLALGSVSGAHFNPAVTLADRVFRGLSDRATVGYIGAQIAGGVVGVVLANLMFDLSAITLSTTARSGTGLWLAEGIATFGLLLVIFGVVKSGRSDVTAFAGIEPSSAPAFIVAELIGTALAIGAAAFLFSHMDGVADQVVVSQASD